MKSLGDIGLAFTLHNDSWSRLFAILIVGIGSVLFVYAWRYLKSAADRAKFYSLMSLFGLAMLALVHADDALFLFLAWEVTSLVSYLLISFEPTDPKIRKGALTALLVTSLGGLFLLAGFATLHVITESWSLQHWIANAALIREDPRVFVAGACILIGALTKSAQFPFHFWLPAAMTAPSPVSAFLHSATMVKAGVYLTYRLWPIFGELTFWNGTLLVCGGITFVWGASLSLLHDKMKSVLAGTTVSMLGSMFLVQGLAGGNAALSSRLPAVLFGLVFAHAIYKAGYFLFAGTLTFATRDKRLSPLAIRVREAPGLALAGTILLFAASALPGTPLYLAKSAYTAAAPDGAPRLFLKAVFFLLAFMPVRFLFDVFQWNAKTKPAHEFHPPPQQLVLPITLLGLVGIFGTTLWPRLGLPELVELREFAPTGGALGQLLQLAAVLAIFFAIKRSVGPYRTQEGEPRGVIHTLRSVQGDDLFLRVWEHFLAASSRVRRLCQPGSLRAYLSTLLLAGGGVWGYFVYQTFSRVETSGERLDELARLPAVITVPWLMTLAGIGVACVLGLVLCVRAASVLASVVGLSLVGFSVAAFFAISGAPDLAMTQFSVEALSLLLFLAALRRVQAFVRRSSSGRIAFDVGVAVALGLVFFATMWLATHNLAPSALTPFFAERSLTEGFGRNVVNVILVDFRGFDTLGEITVLSIAGLAISGLLLTSRSEKPSK